MKYIFSGLEIELTRRCNMACEHCLRGEAQNLTISEKIIDKIFADTENCLQLYIAGGEPLLEPDRLKYLLDKVSKNWDVLRLEVTTNGSVLDASIVDALESFCRSPLSPKLEEQGFKRKAQLTVSHDEFHVAGECQKALEFYRPLFDIANQKFGEIEPRLRIQTWSPINLEEVKKNGDDADSPTLIYAGRGIDLLDRAIEERWAIRTPFINNHRLKITGNVVHCRTMISAKGDIIVAVEDDSYESYDKNAVGNILVNNLGDIIDAHQNNCVLSCNETNYINQKNKRDLIFSHIGTTELSNIMYLQDKLVYEINSNTLKLRQMLKATYPVLTAQDLIGELPMVLNQDNLIVLVERIRKHTHRSIKTRLSSEVDEYVSHIAVIYKELITPENYNGIRMICEAILYMRNNGLSLIMKLRKWEMQTLIEKAKAYSDGKLEPNNDGVFACGESDIFANENDIGKEYAEDRKMADYYRALDEFSKRR